MHSGRGIYRKASQGKASHVPGVQAVDERPERPDLVIRGDNSNPEEAGRCIVELLDSKGFLKQFASERVRHDPKEEL
jgi:adenylylsulfate kinase-like enzyme